MGRFTGRTEDPVEFGDEPSEDTVTVGVRAFLSFSLYVPSAQLNRARMILIEDSDRINDYTEKLTGKDGETGESVEITISYPE